MAPAQQLAQQTAGFSRTQRISLSSICHERSIFDEDCFKTKLHDGLQIHQLDSASQQPDGTIVVHNNEAFMLTQWLERGVFKALEEQFLHALTFAVCARHPLTGDDLVLEKYEFKLTYMSEGGGATLNGEKLDSKDDLKQQAKKFLRTLISFTSTLDTLPADRWLTMMIKYADDAQEDYEPEYFKSCGENALVFCDSTGNNKKLRIKLGGITTKHAGLGVVYSGFERLLHEDLCSLVPVPLGGARHQEASGSDDDNKSMVSMATESSCFRGTKCTDVLASKMTSSLKLTTPTEEAARDGMDPVNRVREHILTCGKAMVRECSAALSLPENVVKDAFQKMMDAGQIKRQGSGYCLDPHWSKSNAPTFTSAVEDGEWQDAVEHSLPAANDAATSRSRDTATAPTSGNARHGNPPAAPRKKKPADESQSSLRGKKGPLAKALVAPIPPPAEVVVPAAAAASSSSKNHKTSRSRMQQESTEETKLDTCPEDEIEDFSERMDEVVDEDETQLVDDTTTSIRPSSVSGYVNSNASVSAASAASSVAGKRRGREESSSNAYQSNSDDDKKKRSASSSTVVNRMPTLDMQVRKTAPGNKGVVTQQTAAGQYNLPLSQDSVTGPPLSQESELSLHGTARYSIIEKPIYQRKQSSQSQQ